MMLDFQTSEDGNSAFIQSAEEMECKICYCMYNLGSRRPKVLECCHRLCSKCLIKILDLGELPPNALVCPFCRCITALQGDSVSSLPDDCNLVSTLALQRRNQRNSHHDTATELLLNPRHLTSLRGACPSLIYHSSISSSSSSSYSTLRNSPNFVVITIMEPPPASAVSDHGHRSPSLDSISSITQQWTLWNCAALLCQTSARVLVWVLGLLYFSSLPMGVYLLILQRTTAGMLLVSLVPSSLIMIIVYGFCHCVCHEFWDCVPP
uniref:E3 ubiquitin-protein ligase RNF182 n=1 Tax=Oryzias latipes TaxID=8090 RepID=A0A3P9LEU9_ORYLA